MKNITEDKFMPSSRGGGSFGGGGGHSFGGGSFGSGKNNHNAPKHSSKPFVGARRYYYFDLYGARRYFYYSAVPQKQSIGGLIVSMVVAILIFSIFLFALVYAIVPHKLKPSKCEFYPSYVHDESGLFNESDKNYLTESLEKFYKETGVQPYVYVLSYDDVPEIFKPVNKNNLHDYAYELYLDTFNDEGHCLILYALNVEYDTGIWIEMTGDDAQTVFKDDDFKVFQKDLTAKLKVENCNRAIAIADTFTENIDTVMKLETHEIIIFGILVSVFILVMIVIILSTVRSVKVAKQVNDYCTYRENNGGVDFVETEDGTNVGGGESGTEGSDLFD